MPLTDSSGANYHPSWGYNAYQYWSQYNETQLEKEISYAAELGLNSLRTNLSYEYWREQAPFNDGTTANAHIAALEHFLSTCDTHGIEPLLILFESPPQATPQSVDMSTYEYGVRSPDPNLLATEGWQGYQGSPMHFANRIAAKLDGDDRYLALEVMNEPGNAEDPPHLNRHDMVLDVLNRLSSDYPNVTLTVGTKDTAFTGWYDQNDALDAWQFHMNLPQTPQSAVDYIETNVARTDKPVWCTEWQRTLQEPPTRWLPYLASLAPTVQEKRDNGVLQGDFFWGLMFKPAYLKRPRTDGRTNGVFHTDGAVFYKPDADAVARRDTGLQERTAYPEEWQSLSDFSAFPDPSHLRDDGNGGNGDDETTPPPPDDIPWLQLAIGAGAVYYITEGSE